MAGMVLIWIKLPGLKWGPVFALLSKNALDGCPSDTVSYFFTPFALVGIFVPGAAESSAKDLPRIGALLFSLQPEPTSMARSG